MHWRRKWQPTLVFLPGESQGRGSLVGCHLYGSHRVRHDWSDLAAAAAMFQRTKRELSDTMELLVHTKPTFPCILGSANVLASTKQTSHFPWDGEGRMDIGRQMLLFCSSLPHAYHGRGSVVLEPTDVMESFLYSQLSFWRGWGSLRGWVLLCGSESCS